MATYTQILYHIVFATKNREPVLLDAGRPELFRYLAGVLKHRQSFVFIVNGVADHIHILATLHPSVPLADLVKDMKVASSSWIKLKKQFPHFHYWQDGYSAFTVSVRERDAVIRYIESQEKHHAKTSFHDELKELLRRAGIDFDERYLP